jgi:hypothetical protein
MAADFACIVAAGHGLRPSVSAIPSAGPALPPDRRGRLRNGAAPGDFLAAPRCGARTRTGCRCRQPAMRNGRCRLHGGLSTGPRTAEGRARCAATRRKHGYYSAATRALLAEARARLRRARGLAVRRPTAGHGVLPSISGGRTTDDGRQAPGGRPRATCPGRTSDGGVFCPPSSVVRRPPAGHGVLPSNSAGTPLAACSARQSTPRPGLARRTLLGSTALGLGLTVRPPLPAGHGVLPPLSRGDGRSGPSRRPTHRLTARAAWPYTPAS